MKEGKKELIEVTVHEADSRYARYITFTIMEKMLNEHYGPAIMEAVANKVVEEIATTFVKEHQQHIVANLDQLAITNLVLAKIGNRIANNLEKL